MPGCLCGHKRRCQNRSRSRVPTRWRHLTRARRWATPTLAGHRYSTLRTAQQMPLKPTPTAESRSQSPGPSPTRAALRHSPSPSPRLPPVPHRLPAPFPVPGAVVAPPHLWGSHPLPAAPCVSRHTVLHDGRPPSCFPESTALAHHFLAVHLASPAPAPLPRSDVSPDLLARTAVMPQQRQSRELAMRGAQPPAPAPAPTPTPRRLSLPARQRGVAG